MLKELLSHLQKHLKCEKLPEEITGTTAAIEDVFKSFPWTNNVLPYTEKLLVFQENLSKLNRTKSKKNQVEILCQIKIWKVIIEAYLC